MKKCNVVVVMFDTIYW